MLAEQRTQERRRVCFRLVYDDGRSFNTGLVQDISETGLFLETALPLRPGATVRLTPLLSRDEHLFEVEARVVRTGFDPLTGEPAGMGLKFLHLSEVERLDLIKLIRKLETEAAHEKKAFDPYLGVRPPRTSQDTGQRE